VTPGQGSQSEGMLLSWLQDDDSLNLIKQFSEICEIDLLELGTTADQSEVTATNNAQPLLASLAFLSAKNLTWEKHQGIIFSGHSVGELSACSLAGFYSMQDAMQLVAVRGNAMAEAATSSEATGMSAVLGGKKEEVIRHIQNHNLVPANVNSEGQIIASGLLTDLERLAQNPPDATKVRKLDVAGAFHSEFMKPAEAKLAQKFNQINLNKPGFRYISNKDGCLVTDSSDLKNRLVSQISSPVRWDMCQATMKDLGVTGMLELAPGGVLTGIAKREMPGVELFAIKSPEDITAAQDFIDKHARIEG
jgi:[acyl-carrier-protein] S-malonyltransferase